MRRRPAGVGLIEALLALALGLMVLAAASQVFGSAYQAWRLQGRPPAFRMTPGWYCSAWPRISAWPACSVACA
jgi:divalent metal cation (Fe/Co/Zn/Cd) transporter